MPLLDHFHPLLSPSRHWESFHVNWAGAIADALNERLLPDGYFAEEHAHAGARVEIDVAAFRESAAPPSPSRAGGALTLPAQVWTPPEPALTLPGAFPDSFEVLIFQNEGGAELVAAIELVSPSNKDRSPHRRAFTIKCASYLSQGMGLVIVDIVTSRQANLHNEMMQLMGHGDTYSLPAEFALSALAYRPVLREQLEQIDVWPAALALGQVLPVLPLALNAELCLPLDLESTYSAACRHRRLT